MGIPKFFRWLSQRYPNAIHDATPAKLPQFDNLYLDMNGIIHKCTHPEGLPEGTVITEEEMFQGIFEYIDYLVGLVQPRKLIYMAIDGSAPRSKMNQQRSRRFRSAKEAQDKQIVNPAYESDESTESPFDSNCITPGTEFMDKLTASIEYYIQGKISTEKSWESLRVIFSSHQVPGEGEHKIMEFIRHERLKENYDVSATHCFYGGDADLIMLGLVTHEYNFSILREAVDYKKPSKFKKPTKASSSSTEKKFQMVYISVLRDYLKLDIGDKITGFSYSLDRVIDDIVLSCMTIGNDFMPNLPGFDIADNTLDHLFDIYPEFLSEEKTYLHEYGDINFPVFKKFLKRLLIIETSAYGFSKGPHHASGGDGDNEEGMSAFFSDGQEGSLDYLQYEEQTKQPRARDFKTTYYRTKFFKGGHEDPGFMQGICQNYIRGLYWTINYYYHGIISWDWYFPYHYAPFLSDVTDTEDISFEFDLGAPFLPFQQLLSVLPPYSAKLLPEAYQELMLSKESPIHEFYPDTFETDLNGKKASWEGVVLIPFIDKDRLFRAYNSISPSSLTKAEALRNRLSNSVEFVLDWTSSTQTPSPMPKVLPDIPQFGTKRLEIKEEIGSPLGRYPPPSSEESRAGGKRPFPSLLSKRLTTYRKKGTSFFGQKNPREALILKLAGLNCSPPDLLHKEISTEWPLLTKGKIVCVLSGTNMYTSSRDGQINADNIAQEIFDKMAGDVKEFFMTRKGIDLGKVTTICCTHNEKKSSGYLSYPASNWFTSHFADEDQYIVPVETVPKHSLLKPISSPNKSVAAKSEKKHVVPVDIPVDIPVAAPVAVHADVPVAESKVSDEADSSQGTLPIGTHVVVASQQTKYIGTFGVVSNVSPEGQYTITGSLFFQSYLPKIDVIIGGYMSLDVVAHQIQVSLEALSRLIGFFPVSQDYDLGLQLTKDDGHYKAGPVRKSLIEKKSWDISSATVHILMEYKTSFPILFNLVCSNDQEAIKAAVADEDTMALIRDLAVYRSRLPFESLKFTSCIPEFLSKMQIKQIQTLITKPPTLGEVYIGEFPGTSLILSDQSHPYMEVQLSDYTHGDQVINIFPSDIPFGTYGIVVGISKPKKTIDVLLEINVQCGNSLNSSCDEGRGVTRPINGFMNISALRRNLQSILHPKPTLVKPNTSKATSPTQGKGVSPKKIPPKTSSPKKSPQKAKKSNQTPGLARPADSSFIQNSIREDQTCNFSPFRKYVGDTKTGNDSLSKSPAKGTILKGPPILENPPASIPSGQNSISAILAAPVANSPSKLSKKAEKSPAVETKPPPIATKWNATPNLQKDVPSASSSKTDKASDNPKAGKKKQTLATQPPEQPPISPSKLGTNTGSATSTSVYPPSKVGVNKLTSPKAAGKADSSAVPDDVPGPSNASSLTSTNISNVGSKKVITPFDIFGQSPTLSASSLVPTNISAPVATSQSTLAPSAPTPTIGPCETIPPNQSQDTNTRFNVGFPQSAAPAVNVAPNPYLAMYVHQPYGGAPAPYNTVFLHGQGIPHPTLAQQSVVPEVPAYGQSGILQPMSLVLQSDSSASSYASAQLNRPSVAPVFTAEPSIQKGSTSSSQASGPLQPHLKLLTPADLRRFMEESKSGSAPKSVNIPKPEPSVQSSISSVGSMNPVPNNLVAHPLLASSGISTSSTTVPTPVPAQYFAYPVHPPMVPLNYPYPSNPYPSNPYPSNPYIQGVYPAPQVSQGQYAQFNYAAPPGSSLHMPMRPPPQ